MFMNLLDFVNNVLAVVSHNFQTICDTVTLNSSFEDGLFQKWR